MVVLVDVLSVSIVDFIPAFVSANFCNALGANTANPKNPKIVQLITSNWFRSVINVCCDIAGSGVMLTILEST